MEQMIPFLRFAQCFWSANRSIEIDDGSEELDSSIFSVAWEIGSIGSGLMALGTRRPDFVFEFGGSRLGALL
jgi:hypothetical protein